MELLSHLIRVFYPLFKAPFQGPFSRLQLDPCAIGILLLAHKDGTQLSLSHFEPHTKPECGFPSFLCSSEWRFRSQHLLLIQPQYICRA